MSIMDFFKPSQQPSGPQQQPQQQQQNPQSQGTNTPQGNGSAGGQSTQGNQNQSDPNSPATPLDAFGKMWDNSAAGQTDSPPSFNLDPKVMSDVSNGLDFMQGIPADLMQRVQSGDSSAIMEMMQHVARNAYRTSLQHNTALADKFVNTRLEYEQKNLAPKVRGELTTQALSSLPNFNHPVVKQQLNDTANRLQKQYPDASPQEIAKMASDYIKQLAAAINPSSGSSDAQGNPMQQAQETDWSKWLSQES